MENSILLTNFLSISSKIIYEINIDDFTATIEKVKKIYNVE